MDSSTLLDHALFQLTPTRTRCDLIIFRGGKTEKLASGLFEPFLSHLKFAKDHISRGGYSIKLCPPTTNAPWFTKGTFQRFVRFVNTPAVLERFASLETEISEIENSVQAQDLSNFNASEQPKEGNGQATNADSRKSADSAKPKDDLQKCDDDKLEENSKIQLHRLLETRKMLLCKEQAMAYARGLAAGFEVDNIDDLIFFADAFGASRLREACINFKELFKKKRGDGRWMEELAAMKAYPPSELSFLATSGIVLSSDNSTLNQNASLSLPTGSTSTCDLDSVSRSDSTSSFDGKKDENSTASANIKSATNTAQAPMPWPNQILPYMYHSQSPFQQTPPYQGYPFTYMQPIPSQYPMNMQWPPNMKQPSPAKKEKHMKKTGFDYSSEEKQMESSGSEVESDSDCDVLQEKKNTFTDASNEKKHRKKSSKRVVIQNINYITPKKRNEEKDKGSDESTDEDELMDEESLRRNVGDAVGAWEKMHKSNSSKHRKRGLNNNNGNTNELADAPAQDCYNDPDSIASETGKNEHWDAFRSLLMRDEETTVNRIERLHPVDIVRSSGNEMSLTKDHAMSLESEKVPKQGMATGDSLIVTQRDGENGDRVRMEVFENGEELRSVLKSRAPAIEDMVIPQRIEESVGGMGHILSSGETEPSTIKPAKGDDWFIVNHSVKTDYPNVNNEHTIFDGNDMLSSGADTSNGIKNTKETLVDDSFMVHNQPSHDLYDSQWRTDISMVADLSLSSPQENGTAKHNHETMDGSDPNDLFMVLGQHGVESVRESWSTDLGIDISFVEAERRCSRLEVSDLVDKKSSNCDSSAVKKNESNGKRVPPKEARSKILPGSVVKNRTEMMSRNRKASVVSKPTVQKSKLEKEEELRKKMEELSIQRQKRISERTASACKKSPSENKTSKGSTKFDKDKAHPTTRETNRASSLKIRAI